jgi:hypothetical protein
MTFFYNLNKKLDEIRATPELTHKQLNERDMSRAAKGYEKYGKQGMEALAKAGREGKALDPVRKKYDKYDEGAYQAGPDKSQIPAVNRPGNKMTLQDLDKERTQSPTSPEGLKRAQQRLGQQSPLKEKMSPAKAKSFAALAEPKDKITFADKIAGAKKEVDEMLGDVAAEAMKQALGGGKQVVASEDDDNNPFTNWKKPRAEHPKVGSVERGALHDIEHTATGRKVTRRVDPNTGHSVGADDDKPADGEKRGRGRPKGAPKGPERVTAKATKHKDGRKTNEGADYGQAQQIYDDLAEIRATAKQAQRGGEFPQGFASRLESVLYAAMTLIKNQQAGSAQVREEEIDEKAVSKKQQKFMGMVHATQKGEKAPSKEVAKVAKTMKKGDAEDFASTKHKGLPEKKKSEAKDKKEESVEETSDNKPSKSSGGIKFGGGIYDSMNRDLEHMIAESMNRLDESMNISINMSNDPHGGPGQSITVTATDEDAVTLGQLLKSAGLGGAEQGGCGCGSSPCSCGSNAEVVDENQPDWPTNTETSDDALQYSGGLNRPKSTGQTTVPVIASQDERQESYAAEEEDAIKRMMEMAGVKKKEVDEEKTDEGNKFTGNLAKARADGKTEADLDGDGDMEKVKESIFDLTNQWKAYKG